MEQDGRVKVLAKVKELMDGQGYSQPKLAELAGISFQSLNNYFAGRSQLTDKAAEKLLSVFGLSVYEVLEEDLPVLNKEVRGYLEYNGVIKRINSFKDAENFVKKYKEEIVELPKKVKADAALDAKNKKTATKHKVEKWDIVLDRVDTYDCSKEDVWAFRKTDDEREDITLSLGNMCPGFDFEMNGQHFYGSEQAYICGMFSNNIPQHIRIQQALIDETNGYGSKKQIRQKNEVLKREDWETFNIEWMKYVVWNKVKGNEDFRKLLLSVPHNAYIVENSTHQKGRTAVIWGAKNQDLEDARDRAVKLLSTSSNGKVKKEDEMKARNGLNYLGVYEGKNLMGKILKLCQLALLEGKELDIDYALLRSKNIYLLGKKIEFKQEPENQIYPSWDTDKYFDDKKKDTSYNGNEPRIWVFKSNVKIFKAGGYVSSSGNVIVNDKAPASIIYTDAFNVNDIPARQEETITGVKNTDCIDWSIELKEQGFNPVVLNFSGNNCPCGFVKGGSAAQEESICRRTNLCQALYPYYKEKDAELVNAPFIKNVYPLDKNYGAIYSPHISVFRATPEEGYYLLDALKHISVISLGAINKQKSADPHLTDMEIAITENRIRTIYRIGLINGHDSLILGAFGCGAFKTPPEQIVDIFKRVSLEPEFHNKYKGLLFAILERRPGGNKFKAFYDTFGRI